MNTPALRSQHNVNSPDRPPRTNGGARKLEYEAGTSQSSTYTSFDDEEDAPPPPPLDLITSVSKDGDSATPRRNAPASTPTQTAYYAQPPRKSAWARLCSCFNSRKNRRPSDSTGRGTPDQTAQHNNTLTSSGQPTTATPSQPDASKTRKPSDAPCAPLGQGLLPMPQPQHRQQKCLVLDLDETLVHSSFKPVRNPDFIVPVTIDNTVHRVYVLKRPGADEFLQRLKDKYEIVLFTASLAKYANPLLDILDIHSSITSRLFREACVLHCGTYVKDMSKLGRPLKDIIIIDNSPQSYAFQPHNAVPIDSWFDDKQDRQLLQLLPILEGELTKCEDVTDVLDANRPLQWLISKGGKSYQPQSDGREL